MENSTLWFALTGAVPAVCDAEAGERRRSNLTVSQENPPTGNGPSTDSQSGEVVLDQADPPVRKIRSAMEKERKDMKFVFIGGSGLIGSKLVSNLRSRGHEGDRRCHITQPTHRSG
jgi:hypothetical protein